MKEEKIEKQIIFIGVLMREQLSHNGKVQIRLVAE